MLSSSCFKINVWVEQPSPGPAARPELSRGTGQLAGKPKQGVRYRGGGQDKDTTTGTVTKGNKEENKNRKDKISGH